VTKRFSAARLARSLRFHAEVISDQGLARWLFVQSQSRSRFVRKLVGDQLWPKTSRYPLCCRPGTSDRSVYHQVFVDNEYACLDEIRSPELIIDCGANVGYSAAYFLSRFPNALLIAIEPDSGNYATLRKNVARYGKRVRTIRAGVWSRPCGLKVDRTGYRDSRDWAVQVRECATGEFPDVPGISIDDVLAQSGCDRISILKIDIERSELEVFRERCHHWLERCDAIVIELHDAECERVFHRAVHPPDFVIWRYGELTVCMRSRELAVGPPNGRISTA
jgi:FkbM family methyltransferase